MMQKKNGFTLIEMLITILIAAILIVMSTTMYTERMRNGRRSDGMNALSTMALAQERYRTANTTYGTLAQVWSGVTTSTGGYYTLSISNNTGTGYTLTATAIGAQASDAESGTSCTPLQITVSSGTINRTPMACWPQ
jgi:type IV pilus assembly protein PilE